jgi:hypothetical protein
MRTGQGLRLLPDDGAVSTRDFRALVLSPQPMLRRRDAELRSVREAWRSRSRCRCGPQRRIEEVAAAALELAAPDPVCVGRLLGLETASGCNPGIKLSAIKPNSEQLKRL